MSLDVLKLAPATELPHGPPSMPCGEAVPPRGGGEMDFGSDSDSEMSGDGAGKRPSVLFLLSVFASRFRRGG